MTDLKSTAEKAWREKRPVFHRLSEGTCWLVSLPYPSNADRPDGSHWYHILLDAWIWGEVGSLGGWAVGQSFKVPATYNSIEEVQALCGEIESASHAIDGGSAPATAGSISAVVITHSSIDHFVPHVLRAIPAHTPCFASTIAFDSVKSLKHFESVTEFSTHDPTNWKACQVEGMPSWLSIGLLNPSADIQHQNPAVLISFESGSGSRVSTVVYALHGVEPSELEPIVKHGELEILAFMAGMTATKILFGPRITLGPAKTLACVRLLKPRYWIRNHDDEYVNTYGIIGRMLRMDVYDLDRVLKEEAEAEGGEVKDLGETEMVDLRAGQSVALL